MNKPAAHTVTASLSGMRHSIRRAFIDDQANTVPDGPRSTWQDTDVAMGPWPESMQEAHHQAQSALEEILDAVYESAEHLTDNDDRPEALRSITAGAYDSAWETGKSVLTAAMAQLHSTVLHQHPGQEENDDATPVEDSTAMTRFRIATEAGFLAAEAALSTFQRITTAGARAALLVSTLYPDRQDLKDNLAAATAVNAAAQEAVDLVHNEASPTRFDVFEPDPVT